MRGNPGHVRACASGSGGGRGGGGRGWGGAVGRGKERVVKRKLENVRREEVMW